MVIFKRCFCYTSISHIHVGARAHKFGQDWYYTVTCVMSLVRDTNNWLALCSTGSAVPMEHFPCTRYHPHSWDFGEVQHDHFIVLSFKSHLSLIRLTLHFVDVLCIRSLTPFFLHGGLIVSLAFTSSRSPCLKTEEAINGKSRHLLQYPWLFERLRRFLIARFRLTLYITQNFMLLP